MLAGVGAFATIQLAPFLMPASFNNRERGTPVHSEHAALPWVSLTVLSVGRGLFPRLQEWIPEAAETASIEFMSGTADTRVWALAERGATPSAAGVAADRPTRRPSE